MCGQCERHFKKAAMIEREKGIFYCITCINEFDIHQTIEKIHRLKKGRDHKQAVSLFVTKID